MSSGKNLDLLCEFEEKLSSLALQLTQDTKEAQSLLNQLVKLSVDQPDFESNIKIILHTKYFQLGFKEPHRDLAMIELLAASHLLVKIKGQRQDY